MYTIVCNMDEKCTNKSAQKSPKARPDIFVYRDARIFLADLSQWAREQDKRLSYRRVALEAGLRSPNYVQQYLKGKRHFKEETAIRIAEAYGMTHTEIDFYLLLNRFSQALRMQQKRTLYREILEQAIAHGAGTLDKARLRYFSCWYIPVVHAMASLKDFRFEPRHVAHHTVPKLGIRQAREAFAILQDLGIFTVLDDGSFALAEPQLTTTSEIRSIWLREYHDAMIALATEAIERWPVESRNASSLTVTVRTDQVPWLLKRIDDFRNELFAELMGSQEKEDVVEGEVFQINFQAYPVTRYRLEPNEKGEAK